MNKIVFLASFILLIFSMKAYAQAVDIPDEYVRNIMTRIEENIHKFKISNTEFIGDKAAAEFLESNPISEEEAEKYILHGLLSGGAEKCGLDWEERSFVPFMASLRASGKSEIEMSYIGALHGAGMGFSDHALSESGCTAEIRSNIDKQLLPIK